MIQVPARFRESLRDRSSRLVLVTLALLSVIAFWIRIEQRNDFNDDPQYWGVTAYHLAGARAIAEGHPFRYVEADVVAAEAFMDRANSLRIPLSEFEAAADSLRTLRGGTTYRPNFGDQGGWPFFVFLATRMPGVDTLGDVCTLQILIDIGAMLLLYPLGLFITDRRILALLACTLYTAHLPLAYAAAEPFREAWPGFAVIYGMALMLPAWKRGPGHLVRSAAWLAAAGVLVGLATYVRSTALMTSLTLTVITLLVWRRFWPSMVAGAVLGAATLLTLSPWMTFTLRETGFATVAASGRGHSFLTGLAEVLENPMGLHFDDTSISVYIRHVCGYDVEYKSYEYSAACLEEAERFIGDHRAWYTRLLAKRVVDGYLYKFEVPRLRWGFGTGISLPARGQVERWLPPLGIFGCLIGFLFFPRPWIPLLWVVHFWAFIFPFQSHPRLLLGAEWAILMGVAMLAGGLVLALKRLLGRFFGRRGTGGISAKRSARASRKSPKRIAIRAPKKALEEAPVPQGTRDGASRPDPGGAGFLARPDGPAILLGSFAGLIILGAGALLVLEAPAAPAPRNDWRRGLASPDSLIRNETLEKAAVWGVDALPVFTAAFNSADPALREKAVEAYRTVSSRMVMVDFSKGLGGILSASDVEAEIIRTPEAVNGYLYRVSAPWEPKRTLFAMAWNDTRHRGQYKINVRTRLSGPLYLGFLNGKDMTLRKELTLGGISYPMREFLTAEIPYENTWGDSVVAVVFCQARQGPRADRIVAEFDWIDLWFERGAPRE